MFVDMIYKRQNIRFRLGNEEQKVLFLFLPDFGQAITFEALYQVCATVFRLIPKRKIFKRTLKKLEYKQLVFSFQEEKDRLYNLTDRGRILRRYILPIPATELSLTSFPVLVTLETAAEELGLSLTSLRNKKYSFLHYISLPGRRNYVIKKVDRNSEICQKIPTLPIIPTYSKLLYLFPNPPQEMTDLLNNLRRNGGWDWNEVFWHIRLHAEEKPPSIQKSLEGGNRDE